MQITLIWDRVAPEYRTILVAGMNEESLRITDLLAKIGRRFAANTDAPIDACRAKGCITLAIGIVRLAAGSLGGCGRAQRGGDGEYRKELRHIRSSRKNCDA
jgi:hypothetical protein